MNSLRKYGKDVKKSAPCVYHSTTMENLTGFFGFMIDSVVRGGKIRMGIDFYAVLFGKSITYSDLLYSTIFGLDKSDLMLYV